MMMLLGATDYRQVSELRQVIHQADPGAFVIFQEGVRVEGNFHRRLT